VRNGRKRSDAVTAEANARRPRRAFGEDARWLMAAVLANRVARRLALSTSLGCATLLALMNLGRH
jgi:hypothetical protein